MHFLEKKFFISYSWGSNHQIQSRQAPNCRLLSKDVPFLKWRVINENVFEISNKQMKFGQIESKVTVTSACWWLWTNTAKWGDNSKELWATRKNDGVLDLCYWRPLLCPKLIHLSVLVWTKSKLPYQDLTLLRQFLLWHCSITALLILKRTPTKLNLGQTLYLENTS